MNNVDKAIRQINRDYAKHFRLSYGVQENPATKLADRYKVQADMSNRVMGDPACHSLVLWVASQDPLHLRRITHVAEIVRKDRNVVLRAIREVKNLHGEQWLMSNPVPAGQLFQQYVFEPLAGRIEFVAGPEEQHIPRARWSYLRSWAHYCPADAVNADAEKMETINVQQDARDDMAILSKVAQAVNPSKYASNVPFSQIF